MTNETKCPQSAITSFCKNIFSECGNTWLVDGFRQYFLSNLGEDNWLEITINPENYPGFMVHVITGTEEKMVAHIQKEWIGAFVRKCNLDGVCVSGRYISC